MKKGVLLFIICCYIPLIAVAENNPVTVADTLTNDINLKDVVVTGSRVPVVREMIPTPISVVSRTTIEQSGETNVLPVLMEQVPGLFVTSRGVAGYGVSTGSAGGINMRGFGAGTGRVLILIDGHPQYATIYGHPVADAYIASDIQRVEVSRGATSVLYGSNAMGGAINLITRKPVKDGNSLSARAMGGSYGTQKYTLTDTYRNGKFLGAFSGNYERTDGHRINSDFESFSFYGKAGYEITDEWKVTGNVNVAKSNSQNPGTVDKPMLDGTAEVLRGMAGLSLENNYGITRGAANFYYNWGNHDINDGYTEGGNPRPYLFHSTDYMAGLNLYQSVNLYEELTLTGGFDVKLYGGNAYRNPVTEIYADHVKLHEIAGYILAQQKLGRSMFEVGLRVENHKLYGTEFVPQAGFSVKAADQTNLKLSVSKGFRTPNMRELYMYAAANEELLPESSWSYDLTISQGLLDNRMTAELTLFYTTGDNIIESTEIAPEVYQNRNVGEFTNKGIEFSLNYLILQNLSLNTNYSYLYIDTPITGAPRNKFYAGVTYSPGKFTFNLGTMVIDKLYLSTGKEPVTSNYTLVNARVAYRPLKWLEVFTKGDNLLAKKYETMPGFPMPRATFMGGVSIDI